MSRPSFPVPRFSPAAQVPPIDFEAEHLHMTHWRAGERVLSDPQAIGSIILGKSMLDYLAQQAPPAPKEGPSIINSQIEAQLEMCRKVFDAATAAGMGGTSWPPQPMKKRGRTSTMYHMYTDRPNASMVHTDYERVQGPHTAHLRYVAALIGPGTKFAKGEFDITQFDDNGNYIADEALDLVDFPTCTVVRFNVITPHSAPVVNPEPRLFLSSTYQLGDIVE